MLREIELEFAQLNHRWKLLCELFENDHNVDLLNRSGAHIFSLFQKLAVDDAMMALCRISDPPKSFGKSNNSLKFYYEQKKGHLDLGARQELERLFNNLDKVMIKIRSMRNLAISHTDHEVATKITNLTSIKYDEIESAIGLVREILNNLFESSGKYMPVTQGTTSATLLEVLSNGLKLQEANNQLNSDALG